MRCAVLALLPTVSSPNWGGMLMGATGIVISDHRDTGKEHGNANLNGLLVPGVAPHECWLGQSFLNDAIRGGR